MKTAILALLVALATASPPKTLPWAGIPLAQVAGEGLGTPEVHALDSGWQAPVEEGGFVRVHVLESTREARTRFRLLAERATTAPQPSFSLPPRALEPEVTSEAVGDGTGYLLFRDGNVIVEIRDHAGRAAARAARLRGLLVTRSPEGTWAGPATAPPSVHWDACGRRVETR